jgi:hypothetical protein
MSADGQLVATIVRMVVPLRREYGFALDVHQFMHDSGYAAAVLDKARASVDPKLRDYAAHVEKQLLGPRAATAAPASTPASPAPVAPARQEAHPTEDELRSRMLRKYTTGLR